MNKIDKNTLIQKAGRAVIHKTKRGETVFEVGDLIQSFEDHGLFQQVSDSTEEWLDKAAKAEDEGELDRANMCLKMALKSHRK